jgi:preprotein translocase subunit SecD
MLLHEGFHRAWLSIRDSNISSIITAVVLFWLGTSAVKGFALTLGLGVLISMFTAITVSRTFLFAIAPTVEGGSARRRSRDSYSVMAFISNNMFVVRLQKVVVPPLRHPSSLSLYGALIAYGFNLSIDFKGGTLTEVKYSGKARRSTRSMRRYRSSRLGGFSVRPSGSADYIIRTKSSLPDQSQASQRRLK